MPRKPRVEYAGAVCHVMNCGDRVGKVFRYRLDYEMFLAATGEQSVQAGRVEDPRICAGKPQMDQCPAADGASDEPDRLHGLDQERFGRRCPASASETGTSMIYMNPRTDLNSDRQMSSAL